MKISIKEGDMKNLINKMRKYEVIQSIPLSLLHLYSQTIKIVEACSKLVFLPSTIKYFLLVVIGDKVWDV